jgi:PAN domain
MSEPTLNNSDKFLKFSSLEKEYQNTLSQYQEAYQTYAQQMNEYTSANPPFVSKQGKTWWGTTGLSEGSVATKDECENQCKENKDCTGATYDEGSKYCWIRGGDGSLGIANNNNYYAIIPQLKANIIQLQLINSKLIALNEELRSSMKELEPYQAQQTADAENGSAQLKKYYGKLLKERAEMTRLLNEYDTLNQENTNQNLYLNEQNNWLFFWKIVIIILVITIYKVLFSTRVPMPVSRRIWIFIFVMLFALTFSIHTPSGFLVWGTVLLIIILMLANFIPGPSIFNGSAKTVADNRIVKMITNNLNPEKLLKPITPPQNKTLTTPSTTTPTAPTAPQMAPPNVSQPTPQPTNPPAPANTVSNIFRPNIPTK